MEKKELMIKRLELLFIIFLFILILILIVWTPIINKYRNYGDLVISEIMPSNKMTIKDSNDKYSDYIEIYNGYDYDLNISGYYLSDDNFDTKKWSFPKDTIIRKDEYLLIYATGNNECSLCTNFKLDNNGEIITLSDSDGKVLSKVYYLLSNSDTSYGLMDGKYVYFYEGTPGSENSGEYSVNPIGTGKNADKLYINEYLINNVSYFKNKNNTYDAMIEIYNDNNYDVDLDGYHLSNNTKDLRKYSFSDIVIKAKSYLVLYASGNNNINDEIHLNFKINNEDVIILSDKYGNVIDKVVTINLPQNISYGRYNNKWHYYNNPSFGMENDINYLHDIVTEKDIIINEVSESSLELRNISDRDINLSTYSIGDKSGKTTKLPNVNLKKDGYIILYESDNYAYKNGKIYTGFKINNRTEELYLYKDSILIDSFMVGKISSNISAGIDDNGERVLYKNKSLGKANSSNYFYGYTDTPKYNINGGYVDKDTKIVLSTNDDSKIYYTLDGSFPSKNSKLYTGEINITKNTVIKALAYKDGYIESDIVSRTFFVGRKHDLPVISISASSGTINNFFKNYTSNKEIKISFEMYESDGSYGIGFTSGTKFTGMDSRKRKQKSMAIYLRNEYGLSEVTYPLFKDGDTLTYSSFTLRNSGEDPYGIRIEDTVLTYALNGQMDIDMQDYRPVVVYINGSYYGLYNMREKLNGDYIESKFGYESYDLIKYASANTGSINGYNKIVNYINSHNVKKKDVYEYIKSQIDVQELCNYLIVESYYANTDQGNIRYWKGKNGKWRWMLYDLDWSLYNTSYSFGYPVVNGPNPAVTSLGSLYQIGRKLYQNSEFRELYISTFAYHLKNTWNPSRMNKIVDELANEIRSEMPYHISRWNDKPGSVKAWNNNVNNFKSKLKKRYNYVVKNIKSELHLTNNEYKKYFGDIK